MVRHCRYAARYQVQLCVILPHHPFCLLSAEIIEYTAPDETAVCNLASIALPRFVRETSQQVGCAWCASPAQPAVAAGTTSNGML
jgi:hypothetical protein